jgi:hypothetical protein
MTRVKAIIAAAVAISGCSEGDRGRVLVRAVSEQTGIPSPGIRVQIGDGPWQTTDEAGEASFGSVYEPFDVLLHAKGERWDDILILQGRTGDEVIAEISRPEPSRFHGGHAIGTVAQRAGEPPESVIQVGVAPFKDWSVNLPAAEDATFDMGIPWRGPEEQSTATLVLRAWETDAADPPGHYYGFGQSSSLSFVEYGEAVTGVTMALEPVEETTVDATISLPAGVEDPEMLTRMWLTFDKYEQLGLASLFPSPEAFDLVVPSLSGASSWIGVWGGPGHHFRRVDAATTELAFTPPDSPELLAPADGASIEGAVYRWNPIDPDGTSSLFVSCSTPDTVRGIGFRIELEGSEASLPTIPDVGLPAGVECRWFVFSCAATDRAAEERCAWSDERTLAL